MSILTTERLSNDILVDAQVRPIVPNFHFDVGCTTDFIIS